MKKLVKLLSNTDVEFVPKDKWVRLIGIPLLGILIPLLTANKDLSENHLFSAFLISIVYTAIHWEGNRFIIVRLRSIYSNHSMTLKRIVIQIIFSVVFTAFVNFFICYFLNVLIFNHPFSYENSIINFKISLVATLFVATVYECFYIFNQWEKTLIESEELKRENLISQFETLKNQVNPHFLFNSFNTLITIIPENTDVAIEFVQKLSNVYRYVLNNKDKELIDLNTELSFLKDYVFLHKIRFGENLIVNINVPDHLLSSQIAPLTLQMLIENAVKHNIISSEKPLTINVYINNDNCIVIENNLQKKSTPIDSTKVGLQNIINRYKYLSQKMVEIMISSTYFKVSLPILSIDKNDSPDH